jgi:prepilin-type N-terminal cleavage/methylation domain-containing protein
MRSKVFTHHRGGYSLIEIMIVVAIIALLAAVATGNALRARKRAQATKVKDDLRMLDSALDQWAIENHKIAGDIAQFSDLQPYIKQQNKLNLTGYDLFGQPYGPYSVDTPPKVSDFTFNALAEIAPAEFWSPFR